MESVVNWLWQGLEVVLLWGLLEVVVLLMWEERESKERHCELTCGPACMF